MVKGKYSCCVVNKLIIPRYSRCSVHSTSIELVPTCIYFLYYTPISIIIVSCYLFIYHIVLIFHYIKSEFIIHVFSIEIHLQNVFDILY